MLQLGLCYNYGESFKESIDDAYTYPCKLYCSCDGSGISKPNCEACCCELPKYIAPLLKRITTMIVNTTTQPILHNPIVKDCSHSSEVLYIVVAAILGLLVGMMLMKLFNKRREIITSIRRLFRISGIKKTTGASVTTPIGELDDISIDVRHDVFHGNGLPEPGKGFISSESNPEPRSVLLRNLSVDRNQ